MLDLVALVTGFAFASILKEIAKDAAKDWVKDFFKGLPTKTSQYALKIILPSAHKKAIKAFYSSCRTSWRKMDWIENR
jgi:hypothetical protein